MNDITCKDLWKYPTCRRNMIISAGVGILAIICLLLIAGSILVTGGLDIISSLQESGMLTLITTLIIMHFLLLMEACITGRQYLIMETLEKLGVDTT